MKKGVRVPIQDASALLNLAKKVREKHVADGDASPLKVLKWEEINPNFYFYIRAIDKNLPMKSLSLLLLFLPAIGFAQQVKEPKDMSPEWSKPYEPFRIVGNVYYVGTADLACYLITTPEGHILINTGLAASAPMIENSISALGFKLKDVKILLTTQAHWDHNGAMAEIKKKTGARLMVNEKDRSSMEDGGNSDFAFGGNGSNFQPVKVDRSLKPDDLIELGDVKVKMLHHPGHSRGSSSFLFTVKDENKSYQVLIANMPTIVTDKKLTEVASYPTLAEDLARTLAAMKALTFDLWLSSHASQFNMHSKHKPGDPYNPEAFIDPAGYDAALENLQRQYEASR
jgi:metallo-beta-lactamase class B